MFHIGYRWSGRDNLGYRSRCASQMRLLQSAAISFRIFFEFFGRWARRIHEVHPQPFSRRLSSAQRNDRDAVRVGETGFLKGRFVGPSVGAFG
jgi:hypothetical protein